MDVESVSFAFLQDQKFDNDQDQERKLYQSQSLLFSISYFCLYIAMHEHSMSRRAIHQE
jgi:hypothetical protein